MTETASRDATQRPGGEITRETLPRQIIMQLSQLYVAHGHSASFDAFDEDVVKPMLEDNSLNAADLEHQIVFEGPEQDRYPEPLDFLRISCAYCIEAIRANESGNTERAWVYVSFGQYWLGWVSAVRLVAGAGAAKLSEKGSAGANARSARIEELRIRARELAVEYKTPSTAARGMEEEILALAVEKGINMRTENPLATIRTIKTWIKGVQFEGKNK